MAEGCDSKCGICLSFIFTEPKLLDCYHTFCLPCLQKLNINDKKITCPLCTTNISLPDEGVSGLKSYPFKLQYATEENAGIDACELCDDQNIAVSKCLDCQTNLCSNCREYHGKLKTSKNHALQPLNVFKSELDENGGNVKDKCREHGKKFTLFCKPCNCLLCIECSEEFHRRHQVEKLLVLLQNKKEKLLVGIASFKARISILQHTAEMVQLKKENYNTHCLVLKQDVTGHATNLKDQFCSTVDELTNKNLDIIEDRRKKDVTQLDNYMNQIETEKMSLSGLIFTTEDFVNKSSDKYLLEEFSAIAKRLDNVLWKSVNVFPTIHDLNFECNNVTKDVIEYIFGKVIVRAKVSETKPMYPHLPLPEVGLLTVYKAEKLSQFVLENDILDIVPAENDNAWLLTETALRMFSYKGISEKKGHNLNTLPNPTRIVRKSANKIWLWFGGSIFKTEKKNQKKTGYEVPFKNALFCCAVGNGNLFVYNDNDTKFYELSDKDGVQNKFEIEDFMNKMSRSRRPYTFFNRVKRVAMKQSKNLNFVISICDDGVLFTDQNFNVLNTFWKSGAEFNAIATDNYGNVFLADSKNGSVYMLSEKGVFQQDLMSRNESICNTTDMIVDECGHLWLVGSSRTIQVYSYQ